MPEYVMVFINSWFVCMHDCFKTVSVFVSVLFSIVSPYMNVPRFETVVVKHESVSSVI